MSAVVKIIVGIVIVVGAIVAAPFTGGLSLYLIPVGLSLVTQGIIQLITGTPKGTSQEAGKVNVRLAEPIRWLNAGIARQGGGVLFAEFDTAGNLWFLIVHSDSPLITRNKVYLDDIEVTLDGSGNVTTNDFCLTSKNEPYTGSGTKVSYFQLWTTTYTAADPTPPGVAALIAAFSGKWTIDHKLVGTTYTVIKCKAIKIEDRYKIYKWRGPLGLGEPSVSIVADWTRCYDPRDNTQTLGLPATYKFTRNAALIWAWFRTHPFGRNKTLASVNWDRVGEQATICDQVVVGIAGSQARYTCTVTFPEDQERANCEQAILMSMDAQLVFDGDGRSWCRAGIYYEPTLVMSRNRDIIAMESLEAQNGESETQGVITRYVEPDAKYILQPAAPWYNPLYYQAGQSAQFLTMDLTCVDNHNQAMRLAKTMGMRSQPLHKLAPTTGLRGLQARHERVINLIYDNTFAGDYEIYTPVEVNEQGFLCQFGLVPIDPDRFDLLLGEEKPKPMFTDAVTTVTPSLPSAVVVAFNNNRIEATFTPVTRDDVRYEFQYIPTADLANDTWANMTVDPVTNFAYSGVIASNVQYEVRWRTVTSAGRPSAWSTSVPVTNATSFLPTTNLNVIGGVGQNAVSWRNSVSAAFGYTITYRGTTNVFSVAAAIGSPLTGGLGQYQGFTDTALTPGTYYYWNQSFTTTNAPAAVTGPVSGVVT